MSAEKALIMSLLSNYERVGKNGRPVLNISTPVPVRFGLGLVQIDLDEGNKMLALSTWTRYALPMQILNTAYARDGAVKLGEGAFPSSEKPASEWTIEKCVSLMSAWRDEYLTWNPRQHSNITNIRLDPALIWIPDVMLYNTPLVAGTIKDADVDMAGRHAMVVVHFSGRVNWYPHTLFRSSCSVDITNFPFDRQNCHLWFGSWTYNSKELELHMAFSGGIDLDNFNKEYRISCPWEILNVTSQVTHQPSEESDPNFIVLTFDLEMERKMSFTSYILTLPCIFLACLTLVVFWLPAERPDRTSLAMSIFSSFMVLLLILVEAAPPTASSIPTLGIYYCFNMVFIMCSVIFSTLVVNVSRGFNHAGRAPKWFAVLIGKVVATLLFLRQHAPVPEEFKLGDVNNPETRNMLEQNGISKDEYRRRVSNLFNQEGSASTVEDRMVELKRHMLSIEHRMEAELCARTEKAYHFLQWKYLANVMDRFFFLLYFILIIVSLSTLFPRPFK